MKKLIACAAILSFALVSVFAQDSKPASKTNVSTASVFTTDVDNFADVNAWSTVNPETFFGLLGYDGTNGLQLGAAKNFKPGYFAFYLDGNLGWDFNNSTSFVKDTTDSSTKTGDTSRFNFSALYGTGKNGFKLGLYYYGYADDKKEMNNIDNLRNYKNHYTVAPYFKWGTEATLNNTVLNPYAGIRFSSIVDKTIVDTKSGDATIETLTDNSYRQLRLYYGTKINFDKKGNYTHDLTIDGCSRFNFYPKTTYSVTGDDASKSITTEEGKSGTYNSFDFVYAGKYSATDKLKLGFKTTSSIKFMSETTAKSQTVTTSSDSTTTNIAYYKYSGFDFTNNVDLGLTYDVKKNVALNFGAGVTLPSITKEFKNNSASSLNYKKYDADGNLIESKTKWTGSSKPLTLNLHSGAKFVIGDVVTLDVSSEILTNLIDGTLYSNLYSTDTSSANGADKFWANVNKIVFPSFSIQVSTKF